MSITGSGIRVFFLCSILLMMMCGDRGQSLLRGQSMDQYKREGWYPAGLPLVNFNSDEGLGYGLKLALFDNGSREDPFFQESPYFHNVSLLFFQTTGGSRTFLLESDNPYVGGTRFRLKGQLLWNQMLNASYYGIGPADTNRLTDRAGKEYNTMDEYTRDFLTGDVRNYKYDRYSIVSPEANVDLYYDISRYFRIRSGVALTLAKIDPWGGRSFDIDDGKLDVHENNVVSLPTRLEEDGQDDEEGLVSRIIIGAGFDSRDQESDPRKGFLLDYTIEVSSPVTGSEYTYIRHTAESRAYFTPFQRLTMAFRAAYTTTGHDTPFHMLNTFNFLMETQRGLGNNRTLRGYAADRFIGYTMTCANAEARIRVIEGNPFNQQLEFQLVGFIDTGSVYNHPEDPLHEFDYYHTGYGGGVTVIWNRNFVIHGYYGISREATTMSLDFGHAF